MTAAVIVTYDWLTTGPTIGSHIPPGTAGAASMRPDRNWLERSVATGAARLRIGPRIRMGRLSRPLGNSTLTPRRRSASARSPNGRALNWGWPSMVAPCSDSAATGATNRPVVPDMRASITTSGAAPTAPSIPRTRMMAAPGSQSTSAPSARTAPTMASVSSAKSAPVRVVSPSDSAAHTNARFVMLLEPGSLTAVSGGASSGAMASLGGQ